MIRKQLQDELVSITTRLKIQSALEYMLEQARECVYLEITEERDRLGSSRIGGDPDLPADMTWPVVEKTPGEIWGVAELLAQLDCSRIPHFEGSPVPQSGFLWLFVNSLLYGSDSGLVGIHQSGPVILNTRTYSNTWMSAPAREYENRRKRMIGGPVHVKFRLGISLPTGMPEFQVGLELTGAIAPGMDSETALKGAICGGRCAGQIGGYAISEEGENVLLDSDMIFSRNEGEDSTSGPESEHLALLMKVCSNLEGRIEWGDTPSICVCGRKVDLAQRDYRNLSWSAGN